MGQDDDANHHCVDDLLPFMEHSTPLILGLLR
jgi:hypothetical protein